MALRAMCKYSTLLTPCLNWRWEIPHCPRRLTLGAELPWKWMIGSLSGWQKRVDTGHLLAHLLSRKGGGSKQNHDGMPHDEKQDLRTIPKHPPREPAVPFPWRPALENVANLWGIGELLTVGDPPLLQMGQLPHPLGWINLRRAQWFDLCPMMDLFFIETAEVIDTSSPTLRTWDMHTLMQWVCEVSQSKRQPCFKIQDGTPTDMAVMLSQWQYNPEDVPAIIWQEDDSLLNTSDVDIWMWLRTITPTKGVMVRQHILQLFSEANQWASLVNTSELPVPSGSEMCNSIQATYEPGSQPPLEILMKDPAIWLGKQVGVTYTCVAQLEEYTMHALVKMAHSNTSQLGKHLHEMAKSKDCLNYQKQQVVASRKLDAELSVLAPTNQLSATDSSAVASPPFNTERDSTEMWPAQALYTNSNIHMGIVNDLVTDDLYQ